MECNACSCWLGPVFTDTPHAYTTSDDDMSLERLDSPPHELCAELMDDIAKTEMEIAECVAVIDRLKKCAEDRSESIALERASLARQESLLTYLYSIKPIFCYSNASDDGGGDHAPPASDEPVEGIGRRRLRMLGVWICRERIGGKLFVFLSWR